MLLTQTAIATIYHLEVVKVSSLFHAMHEELAKMNSYGTVCLYLVMNR